MSTKSGQDHHQYYNHFVLNFLQQENLNSNSGLVHVLKNGNRKVYKKDLKEIYPFNKEWLAEFSENNPHVLHNYKESARDKVLENDTNPLLLSNEMNESIFAKTMIGTLKSIGKGSSSATHYHSFIVGLLEFLFWPNLIYPKKEHEIHDGRKRIDITYTNAARHGFFYRIHNSHSIASNFVMVECKNYNYEIKNPELDQLSGRFSINRGKLGFLLFRETDDYE